MFKYKKVSDFYGGDQPLDPNSYNVRAHVLTSLEVGDAVKILAPTDDADEIERLRNLWAQTASAIKKILNRNLHSTVHENTIAIWRLR